MTLLTTRKIDRLLNSKGFRFSANMPKYDENNAGKIKETSVRITTVIVGKKTA